MVEEHQPLNFKILHSSVDKAMLADRFALYRQLRQIQQQHKSNQGIEKALTKWRQRLEHSIARVETRCRQVPVCTFNENLPVSQRRDEIADLLKQHQVLILAGETGSGKTTQIPKICLELGRGCYGVIGHTQPRRLAARTVAARIADELAVSLGQQVGYQVRFTDHSDKNTLIKLMTDGILLAEIQQDRFLERYDTLILDEAHERSLNIDFLLGYIKRILPKRPDLMVIVTSATIDLPRFSQHFDNAPIVEVSGRTYPVEMVYRPSEDLEEVIDQPQAVVSALSEIMAIERDNIEHGNKTLQSSGLQTSCLQKNGDVLVFLSGEREIRETALAIRRARFPHCEVLPLYARLSTAEQNRVFDTRGQVGRRVVLATNVAETSLTVPGIHYVIDPGFARISRYSYRTKVQRLPIEAISQASANQRAGRCGRVANGVCIRLYAEQDFQGRPEFTDAEIQRTNLASVILQMLSMGLGDISEFPFVEPPDTRMIGDGYKLLEELEAVDQQKQLTEPGRALAKLPLDPRIGRMVLTAGQEGSLSEVLIIASALSIQDPRERPADKQQAADQMHRRFADKSSDFMALVNLWAYFETQRQALSNNQLRKLCKKEFLSYMRMREWRDIHYQLRLAVKELGLKESEKPADYRTVHRALLAGLLSHIGFRYDSREYQGARNRRFKVFPGSFLFKKDANKQPKWLLAAELVETTQLYARMVARIEPDWVFGLGEHLFKRSYSEPHWQRRRGQVVALEKITLYGLVVSDKHAIDYGRIDPVVARDIFIQSALVEEQLDSHAAFYRHNCQLIKEVNELESKARRRDILVDDSVIYDFYQARVPASVCSARSLHKWLKRKDQHNSERLKIDADLLRQRQTDDINQQQFPDQLTWQGVSFQLRYRFEPGHARDGVTALIPLGVLNRVPDYLFEWLVPGLLREKCIALVKSLPKRVRKHFVPVPEWVDRAMTQLKVDDYPLVDALAGQLQQLAGVVISLEEWSETALDDYYRMNFQVVSAQGEVLGEGRDLAALVTQFRGQVQQSLAHQTDQRFIGQYQRWEFEDLPSKHQFQQAGVAIEAFPALVEQGDSVVIELCDYESEAQLKHREGINLLLRLAQKKQLKNLRKDLLLGNEALLQSTVLSDREALLDDVLKAIVHQTFLSQDSLPRSKDSYTQCVKQHQGELVSVANAYNSLLLEVIRLYYDIIMAMKGKTATAWENSYKDIRQQLSALLYPGFVYATPFTWLQHYPRYLTAVKQRLEKLSGQVQRDITMTAELASLCDRLNKKMQEDYNGLLKDRQLQLYRWMIEEYRVSLFAQRLGTQMPVSVKRLDKQWQLVEQIH